MVPLMHDGGDYMNLTGNFFELIFNLFYFFLKVSQFFFDFLTHKVVLKIGDINLGIIKIPIGVDFEFYPSLVLASQLFIALMGLRFIKKFVPLA